MTAYFVDSAAAGLADGTSWTDAYTALATAVSGKAAGDTFYVAHTHSENNSGTITFPGTSTAPVYVLCVTAGSTPTSSDLTTGAVVGSANATSLTINGSHYSYGMTYQAGQGSASAANILSTSTNHRHTLANCKLILNNTSASSNIQTGSNVAGFFTWINTQVKFGSGSQVIVTSYPGAFLIWKGGPYNGVANVSAVDSAGSIPTNLFSSANFGKVFLEGVDLSSITSKTLIPAQSGAAQFSIKDCKFGSSTTVSASQTVTFLTSVDSIRSDSASTTTRLERFNAFGKMLTSESIYRNGGANNGTTSFSRAITPSSRALWVSPFVAPPIAVWNDTTGSSVTVTVQGTSDLSSGAFPNNDDIWIDVVYESDSSTPVGSVATSGKANPLSTATAYDNSSASWVNQPNGGTYKMTATFTPQRKGWIYVYVTVGNVRGGTPIYYYDPVVVLS